MDVLDAFYHTVHDYPGGAESLAPRMGYSSAVLRNKADPRKDSNKPLLADADHVMGLAQDYRVLRALAHKHGFLMVKAPESQAACDMSVLEQIVELGMASGEFMRTIHGALADGRVDERELNAIREAQRVVQTAAATVTNRLEGMADR